MDDIDTSQYYVVRKGEYEDMKTEIDRLRFLVKLWKNAAEAYERGSLGEGDRLVSEARERSELIDETRKGNQS